jgi:hypothetical protein
MSDVTTIPADVPAPYADALEERLERALQENVAARVWRRDATLLSGLAPPRYVEIPGEPYSFATLIRAQADGDLQTLRGHGLDAARVHVEHTDQIKELL